MYTGVMRTRDTSPFYDMLTHTRDDRPRFVSPRRIVSELNLWKNDHVMDMRAGAGHFIPYLREAVGNGGAVYTRSENRQMLATMHREAMDRGHMEVRAVHHTFGDGVMDIESGILDAALLSNALAEYLDVVDEVFAESARLIRRGGKLCVVDWRVAPSLPTENELVEKLARFGFMPKRELSPQATGSYHYGIIFTKY